MKKTFKTMLALMAGAMTFTGCTSDILENTPEQIPSALKPMTFTATQESDATRAAIVGTAINWTTGDKISIFDGGEADEDGNLAREFALTGGENTPSGTFTGTAATASTYYALYPYASSTYEENGVTVDKNYLNEHGISIGVELEVLWDDYRSKGGQIDAFVEEEMAGKMPLYMGMSAEQKAIVKAYFSNEEYKEITKSGPQLNAGKIEGVAFPAAQTATVGTADPKAMLMIGTSDDRNNIQFKNVCAYLKVTPTFACSSIVLKSNGTESLAGTVTLDYNEGNPTTTVTNGTNTVTLSGTIAATSTYYIAVLPATLEGGFTVEFKDASDVVIGSKSTTKSVTFARNKVINLGSFNMYPPEGSNGSATRTGNAEVNWVQLWKDGPKFAEYNIGATSVIDYNYDYYCWGRSINKENPGTCNSGSVTLTGADDTATALWGSNWRMPAEEDFQTLFKNCTVEWVTNYKGTGVNGLLCTGKVAYAANSIFLPAGASCNDGKVLTGDWGSYGNYWTSTPVAGNTANARYLHFRSTWHGISPYDRTRGFAIRPVLNEATTGTAKATIGGSEVDVNWVQLWADGPKFAEYNVGVTDRKAESYGGYYCWGKSVDQDPGAECKGGSDVLSGTDDTATNLWGSVWRMPTKDELQALFNPTNCDVEWTTVGGVNGRKFTGKGDYSSNSIFLPAAGYNYNGISLKGENGFYWSSSPDAADSFYAYDLNFGSDGQRVGKDIRNYGFSVRAVLK